MGRDLAGLAALAKQHGVAIGVHNHQGNLGSALWDIAPHIDRLDPQAIGYYFDPRHALVEGGGVGLEGGDAARRAAAEDDLR